MLAQIQTALRRTSDAVWLEAARAVNRVRHERLHRAAVERLRAMDRPRRILIVCQANLCRSPFLEAVLRRNLTDVRIESAGMLGAGRRVKSDGLAAARERGIDLSDHRSRLLNASQLEVADLVIVMEPRQARLLIHGFGVRPERVIAAGDLDSDAGEPRTIVDPYGRAPAVYARTFARLERCARQLSLLLPADEP